MDGGEGRIWMVGKTRADKLIFVNDNRHQPYPRGEGRRGGETDQGGGAGGRKGGREGGRKGGREGEREGGRAHLASSLEFYVVLFSWNFIGKYKDIICI